MIEFKKILVSLDFSVCATSALTVAMELARSLGAELHLAHVVFYPLQLAVAGPVASSRELEREVRKAGERKLEDAAELARSAGVPATSHLLEGQIAPALVQLAKDLAVDLIVVGRRGANRLTDIMLGSVADRTVRLAPCPVMIVRAADGAD